MVKAGRIVIFARRRDLAFYASDSVRYGRNGIKSVNETVAVTVIR
ncbi:hypothetical protein OKW13_000671 [Bacillus velezensis]|nr:hypothetical protein [Bacillus velezensis]